MDSHGTLVSEIMDEMDPRILGFIRKHVSTFTRWDLLRFLYENGKTQDSAENLARYIGRAPEAIQQEVDKMAAEGLLKAGLRGDRQVYALTDDEQIRQLVTTIVEAARERTFRMKLVYHILRAEERS